MPLYVICLSSAHEYTAITKRSGNCEAVRFPRALSARLLLCQAPNINILCVTAYTAQTLVEWPVTGLRPLATHC